MPTLENINGASLAGTPDVRQSIEGLIDVFGTKQQRDERARLLAQEEQKKAAMDEIMGTISGGTGQGGPAGAPSKRANNALLRLASIDPKMAKTMQEMIASQDEQAFEAARRETEKGTRAAAHIKSLDSFGKKRHALYLMRTEAEMRGEDTSRFDQLAQMSERELDLALNKMMVQGADIKTLTDEYLKPKVTFSEVRDEAGNIIGQRNDITGEIKRDPRAVMTDAQFRQQLELASEKGKAAAAPVNALAGLMQQQRIETERLKQEEMRGKIEERAEKLERGRQAVTSRKEAARTKASTVIAKVGEAIEILDESPKLSAGLGGQILGNVGGTSAKNLKATLDTINALNAFGELQAMREASPTGGALGSVAVRELDLLAATIASMDQAQDAKTLKRNLLKVSKHYKNWLNVMEKVKAPTSPEEVDAQTQPAAINFSDLPD